MLDYLEPVWILNASLPGWGPFLTVTGLFLCSVYLLYG